MSAIDAVDGSSAGIAKGGLWHKTDYLGPPERRQLSAEQQTFVAAIKTGRLRPRTDILESIQDRIEQLLEHWP